MIGNEEGVEACPLMPPSIGFGIEPTHPGVLHVMRDVGVAMKIHYHRIRRDAGQGDHGAMPDSSRDQEGCQQAEGEGESTNFTQPG
jgi:hypothetical protein